ncbi:ABC transporter permease, partial [Flavihumibacter sp. CACIAM 22H1]|uniref:ABC transporter permease n=1 Tax=Flavihumibacter sp. CACIAM 22H1 TaxID=1812911 RepID=UPI0025BF7ECB
MLRTYIKIAWRTIYKNPLFAGINILGLSIGLCFTLLIGIYIWQENRVNTELRNLPNQYIIQSHWKKENLGIELTSIGALPKALKETYPHLVENYFRFDGITGITHVNQRNFRSSISIGDSSFFTMYGFELLQGNAATAFKQPSSVVLSEEAALKYFGRTDVLQESLELENFNRVKQPFQVTGVLKTATRNSVTQLNESNKNDLFLSTESLDFFGRNMSWDNPFIPSYVELKEGVKPETVEAAMNQLIRTHAPAAIAENLEAYLLPLTDYYQSANNQVVRRTNWILGMIGLFILIMALINFINLTISRSNNRLKEVGLRHVMGSNRWQLVKQFLLESVLLVTIALLFALVGYALLKNSFSAMVGKPMPSLQALTTGAWLLISLLVPAIGCVAGIYPAFYLSDIPVTNSLKKQLNSINQHHFIRKSLVGIQFVTAAVVLIGAVVINKQVDFFFSKELGFDKEQVLT